MLKLGILDVEGKKYTLKIGLEYLIGRKSNEFSHDIEIDDQSVDIKHSIIDLTKNSSPQLFDVCSKHGTFVDDVQIPRFKSIPLPKTSKIRFGNVVTCLQLLFEGDSGFLDERLNSPTDETSEIICNTPEHIVSSGSRLKNSIKNSLTSTPNQTTTTDLTSTSKPEDNFLIRSCLPRTSIGSNTSARSADSFYVPETQHVPEIANSRTNNSTDISFYSNKSKQNSTVGDDDFFIPETQEVFSSAIPLSNHARLAFPSDDVNETLSEENRIPSSQFRICTQDFNGSEEDLSNQSGDLLANVPLSLIIPPIKHDAVQIDDIKVDEDDIDNEMSALQWSKKTLEDNADGSITPDGLFDVVGSVTSDLMPVIRKSADKAFSQSITPDIFEIFEEPKILATKLNDLNEEQTNMAKEKTLQKKKDFETPVNFKVPDTLTTTSNNDVYNEKVEKVAINLSSKNTDLSQTEIEYPPTQVFFKPIVINKLMTKPSLPMPPAPDDDCDMLPETQVFVPTVFKSKPTVPHNFTKPQIVSVVDHVKSTFSTKLPYSDKIHVFALPQASPKRRVSLNPQASPKPQVSPKPQPLQKSPSTVPIDEDDLPPTQVFLKDEHVPPPITTNDFSSTLVDCGMQLSENSFKAKFNKLLDSDDDEMDEVIAPHLVKQMRQSLDKPEQPVLVTEISSTPENKQESPSKPEENTALDKNHAITPENNNFRVPVKANKTTNNSKTSAVSIDNFLLTPDFLGKEFSKNSQLQREAEVNWRNLVLEKRSKALFGDENDPKDNLATTDSDDSRDSFIDLLPRRRETRSKSVNKIQSEKVEKPKEVEEVVCARITRRKSTLIVNTITKEEVDKKEPKKRGRKKSDIKTTDIKYRKSDVTEERKDSKNDKVSKIIKVTKQEKVKKKEKEFETQKDKKVENVSKTEKSSSIAKEDKLMDPVPVENSRISKNSSLTKKKEKEFEPQKEKKLENVSKTEKSSSIAKEDKLLIDPVLVENSRISKNSSLTKKKEKEFEKKDKKIENISKIEKSSSIAKEDKLLIDPVLVKNSRISKNSSLTKNSSLVKDSSIVKSDLVKESSLVKKDNLSRKSSSTKESNSSKKSNPNEAKSHTVPKEPPSARTSSSTIVDTSKESKGKIESSKESVGERTRTRRKVEEPKNKEEEKSSRSRAAKRNAEVTKSSSTSSKASKINKLNGLDVDSKQSSDMPSPRITRLRSNLELAVGDKNVILNNNREKIKEGKKEELAKKKSTAETSRVVEEFIDLTHSDKKEEETANKKKAKKRKSEEEYVYKSRKSSISASQSSAESNDSDRTLRKKKKIKIAMTSSSPATREALVRYSGRVWDYTEDPKECDVLILEAGNRTYKLLVAIARGVPVVKVDWLKEVIMMRSTDVPFDKYIFDEANFQNRHKFEMRNSLQLAKSTSLFGGMNFMMTPNITPKPDEMKDIIVCAGGTVLDNIPTSQDERKFYLVSENIDNQLWYRYRRGSKDVKVVTAISLMASVMQQSLEPLIKSIH